MQGVRIPVSTYRLQFHAGFPFEEAKQIVSYLNRLGVTDVYSSPVLQASRDSLHGYDVTDHAHINPQLGGEKGFREFSDELQQHDMGLMVDLVPNHMEIDDADNSWWADVLENGPSSQYATCFDIDWNPPKPDLKNRVMLPVLGDQFGRVLENGEIRLGYEEGGFYIAYYEHIFPVDPQTTAEVLQEAVEHLRFTSGDDDDELLELESVVTGLKHLPDRNTDDPELVVERRREQKVIKRRLSKLTESSAAISRAIEGVVVGWSGRAGEQRSFDRLEQLLRQQAYRLCHWRVATDEINYRRFFDINDLGAIRVEDPRVFAAVHDVLIRMVGEGRISGFRIDHPDGLYDPELYFQTLQAECRRMLPNAESTVLQPTGLDYAIYIVAEKILGHNEELPLEWAVHGTTGYETLNLINGVFVNQAAEEPFRDLYREVCPSFQSYSQLIYQCKKLILKVSMSSELHVLARRLDRVSEQHRYTRDFTLWSLHEALREVIACFPVYRSYVQPDTVEVSDRERDQIEHAIDSAKRFNPAIEQSVFDFIRSVMLLEDPEGLDEAQRRDRREFVMKMQQLTGPVTAKGIEDTAFYRVYPLASLNEVGGEPEDFGTSLDKFHNTNMVRAGRWPYSLVSSSTHDAKRSEDVRAWINVLSEIPDDWIKRYRNWQTLNKAHRTTSKVETIPSANEEYLFYQTVVGIWPLAPLDKPEYAEFIERIAGYMVKALREGKQHTSWVNPRIEYEQAVTKFVRKALNPTGKNPFLKELQAFHAQISPAAMCNALGQLVLKMTVPGVPDLYQGCELWSFRLVDPDNRAPVDYETRSQWMAELQDWEGNDLWGMLDNLLENWRDGRIKLFTTYRALHFRRQNQDLYLQGEYNHLPAEGKRKHHLCGLIRRGKGRAAITLVPRFTMKLTEGKGLPLGDDIWGDTTIELPEHSALRWRNVYTGEEIEAWQEDEVIRLKVADVLRRFPVAILEAIE